MKATLQNTAAALIIAGATAQAVPQQQPPKKEAYHLETYVTVNGVVMTLAEYRDYMEGQR